MYEIESYQPYHIGIKLKNIDLNLLKKQLRPLLKDKKFEIQKDDILASIPIVKEREIIAIRKEVNIELNYKMSALNIISFSKIEMIDILNEILKILDDLSYESKATVTFFEIIATIIIKTDKQPLQQLTRCLKADLNYFNDYGKADVHGLHVKAEKEENEFLDFILEPKITSPEKRLFIRLLFRSKNKDELVIFNKNIEKFAIDAIKSLIGE